jgi:hypothetical protein
MSELITGVTSCRECMVHGEKHKARYELWIPDHPPEIRLYCEHCEHCQKRDAIKDGSVELALIKRAEKGMRRALKDMQRIKDHLSPAMVQIIIDDNERIIGALNELIAMLKRKV